MERRTRRNSDIDSVKGLLILLMVIGHVFLSGVLHDLIYLFHMPCFVLISGFFIKDEGTLQFLNKLIRRLYSPFVITNIIALLLTNKLVDIGIYESNRMIQNNSQYFTRAARILFMLGEEHIFGPLWFIRYLFWSKILVHKIYKLTKHEHLDVAILTFMLMGGYIIVSNVTRIYSIIGVMNFTIIMLFGNYFHNFMVRQDIYSSVELRPLSLLSAIILIILLCINYKIDLNKSGLHILIILVTSLSGYLLCYEITTTLLKTVRINVLGINSMQVLYSHLVIFRLINLLLVNIFYMDKNSIAEVVIPMDNQPWYISLFIKVTYVILGVFIPVLISEKFKRFKKLNLKDIT